jgi:RNA polymerase sigma factor (sigma-70 family)
MANKQELQARFVMTNKADSELVALARSGNKDAFSQLIERYQQMVRRIALGMVAHEEIARELAQEALLQAYLSLDHLRDISRFKSWLYGIVLNVCRSYIRDQKINPYSLEAIMGGMYLDMLYYPSPVIDPEEIVEQRELHTIVLQAVQELSPKDRAATLLFYYERLSMREIAAILGVSITAVKGRLHRAREQLREHLLLVYADTEQKSTTGERSKTMAQVKVAAVIENTEIKQNAIILLEETTQRVLTIYIGAPEAMLIAMGHTEIAPTRPMGIHLLINLLKATGMEFEEARIETLRDDVFYAVAKFRNGATIHELDARPSDAIALAVLLDRPIYVAEEVLAACSIALPEGKTLQVDKDKARASVMRKIEEQQQSLFAFLKHYKSLTAEEREQEGRKFVEFLADMMG